MSNEVLTQSIDAVWEGITLDHKGLFPNLPKSTLLKDWILIEAAPQKMMLKSESLKLFLKLFVPRTDIYSGLAYSCLVAFSQLEGLQTQVLAPLLHHKNSLVFPLASNIQHEDVSNLFTADDLQILEFTALQHHMQLAFPTKAKKGWSVLETGEIDGDQKVIDPLNDLPSRLQFFMNL